MHKKERLRKKEIQGAFFPLQSIRFCCASVLCLACRLHSLVSSTF